MHLVKKEDNTQERPVPFNASLKKFIALTEELITNKNWDHLKSSFSLVEKLLREGKPDVLHALKEKYISSLYSFIEYNPAKAIILKMLPTHLSNEYYKIKA